MMSHKLQRETSARQEQPASLPADERGSDPSLIDDATGQELSLIRQAINDSKWTHEALATVLPVPNAAYISRMLSGEKAWTVKHTASLPNDIKAKYHAAACEREGLIVVSPVDDAEQAMRFVVRGLLGMFGPVSRGASVRKAMARAGLR